MPSPEDCRMDESEMDSSGAPESNGETKVSVTRKQLQELITEVENAPLIENQIWYVISNAWWNKFVAAVNNGYITDINEIDNSSISEKSRRGTYFLKSGLCEAVDYQTVPEKVFLKLRDIFGVDDDTRDYISREVVKKNGAEVVEVYPRVVHVSLARNANIKVDLVLKPSDTMKSLRDRVISELELDQSDNVRFYVSNGENRELVDTNQSLDSYFDTTQNVIVDVQKDGEFFYKNRQTIPQSKSLFATNSSYDYLPDSDISEFDNEVEDSPITEWGKTKIYTIQAGYSAPRNRRFSASTCHSFGSKLVWPFVTLWWHIRRYWWRFSLIWHDDIRQVFAFFFGWWILRLPPRFGNGSYGSNVSSIAGSTAKSNPGQCGLANLGNTCFMASALQCLSNMPALREYFLSGRYMDDLNRENPLGTQGHLAQSVGELFKAMWSGDFCSINPRKFKSIIGQFAPRFNGYSQQDAHELMAYVLDGLHEDLNRIKKKPYFEDNDELAKLPLHEYAAKSWEVYKMRNDSIIVDTLHGQLKSTLICPVCAKISIKFDPFGYLSLPLPPKESVHKQNVIIMFLTRKWAKFAIGITDQTTVADAEDMMMAKLQPDSKHHFVFFYISNAYNEDIEILRPTDKIRIKDKEVYVSEVTEDPNAQGVKIVVASNCIKLTRSATLPMIYTIKSEADFTRSFITDHILKTTKRFFFQDPDALENAAPDDDSMSGNDDREPFKLFITPAGTSTPLPVPPTNDPLGWPEGTDPYKSFQQVTFQWKDPKLFNQYRGSDLVEREVSVSTRRKVHLMETVDWFTTKEQLGEHDLWYCPECKKHERATKQLDLWKLPEVLILHLKRFQYTRWARDKLTWEVVIPVKGLDLTEKLANDKHEKAVYDLIAVSRHYGSLSGGHYTAIAYNDKIDKWIDFNDSSASIICGPTEPYEAADPYILVYRRRRVDSKGNTIECSPAEICNSVRRANNNKRPMHHDVDENVEMEMDDD